jgi:hypothetical protein
VGQERLRPSYFFTSLVLGPLNSLLWYVPSQRHARGLDWRIHCGVEATESNTNKQHISIRVDLFSGCVLNVYFQGHQAKPLTKVNRHAPKGRPTRCSEYQSVFLIFRSLSEHKKQEPSFGFYGHV